MLHFTFLLVAALPLRHRRTHNTLEFAFIVSFGGCCFAIPFCEKCRKGLRADKRICDGITSMCWPKRKNCEHQHLLTGPGRPPIFQGVSSPSVCQFANTPESQRSHFIDSADVRAAGRSANTGTLQSILWCVRQTAKPPQRKLPQKRLTITSFRRSPSFAHTAGAAKTSGGDDGGGDSGGNDGGDGDGGGDSDGAGERRVAGGERRR